MAHREESEISREWREEGQAAYRAGLVQAFQKMFPGADTEGQTDEELGYELEALIQEFVAYERSKANGES